MTPDQTAYGETKTLFKFVRFNIPRIMRKDLKSVKLGGYDFFHSSPSSTTLVVALHGFAGKPSDFQSVYDYVLSCRFADADVIIPALPISNWVVLRPMKQIAAEIDKKIEAICKRKADEGVGYSRIILIGYSAGSLIARAALLHSFARIETETIGYPPPWGVKVERLVLLAGMNRGWSRDSVLGSFRRLQQSFGLRVLALMPFLHPTVLDMRRGSVFLTELRLNWLRLRHLFGKSFAVVQLLGTQDDIVSPADNIDMVTGQDFHYLEVRGSGHANILKMHPGTVNLEGVDLGAERQKALSLALIGSRDEIADSSLNVLQPWIASEYGALTEDPTVKNVVFIVHGIRDYGYWSQKIGRDILRRATENDTVILSPSYGYFPILPFLLPGVRQEKVEWLLDKYVEIRRRYPNARMSYIGHSNGTYLLARALELCPMLEFQKVVFAGSVVRRSFPWHKFLSRQVESVINLVATADWVVASVPRSVQPLGKIIDLGSAGHDGFSEVQPGMLLMNVRYVKGGHSAGISEMLWDDIAEFIVEGTMPNRGFTQKRSFGEKLLGGISSPLFIIAVLGALGIGWSLLAAIFGFNPLFRVGELAAWEFLRAHPNYAWISLLLYVYLLRVFLTKF